MPDEHLFSPRRLYNAWRSWLMYLRLDGTCTYSLRELLTYYRRPMADYRRGKEGK